MKIAVSILAIASAAVLAGLATSSPDRRTSGHGAEPVAESSRSGPPPPLLQGNVPVEAQAEAQSQPADNDAPDASTVAAAPPAPLQQSLAQSGLENEQLGQLQDQLAQLRQQLAAEESQRRDEKAQEAAQHADTLESLDILRQAEALLATGDSDGVDEQLVRAEAALWGRTRLDVEAAREALSRSDLLPARGFLVAALAEKRAPR